MSNFLKEIYQRLQDDISREIFVSRLLYSTTGDYTHIIDMIEAVFRDAGKNESTPGNGDMSLSSMLTSKLENSSDFPGAFIIYGAGNCGRAAATLIEHLGLQLMLTCFCDASPDKIGQTFCGVTVISPQTLQEKYPDASIFIGSSMYFQEIYDNLIAMNFTPEQLITPFFSSGSAVQYFDTHIVQPCENEVFIDGGSYNLDTSISFVEFCGGQYKKIYAFEMDPKNYENCVQRGRELNYADLEIINKGLWSADTAVGANLSESPGSFIDPQSPGEVQVTSIDNAVLDDVVTFIKMDIEGAELEALKGAQRVIRTHKPRLAISLYHKPEDIWEIPQYILGLCPSYKLYLRHYSFGDPETVLYCV